jgi:hypothetical protein
MPHRHPCPESDARPGKLGDIGRIVFTGPVRTTDHGRSTRRDLLRAVGAGLSVGILAGCGIFGSDGVGPEPDPLLPLLTQARELVTAYDGFLAQHPDRTARLQPIRDAHAAHVTALAAVVVQPSPGQAPASPAPATLALLKALESAAAKSAYDACLAARDERVTLAGEIAAARATHVVVLS